MSIADVQPDNGQTRSREQQLADLLRQREIEAFLTHEAALLDAWRLEEWLDLFTADARYEIPAPDLPDADAGQSFSLIHDSRALLEQRVIRLKKPTAHAEFPHSRTRRLITNVAVEEVDDVLHVRANFIVYRFRKASVADFVGHYLYVLERENGALRISYRRAVLDLEILNPHGKVSIIL
jgi:p-cumate 2,3-dioxygenase subunit beta